MEELQKNHNTIDSAISICDEKAKQHDRRAALFFVILIAITVIFILMIFTEYYADESTDIKNDVLTTSMQNHINAIDLHNSTSDLVEKKLEETYYLIGLINDVKSKNDVDSLFKYLTKEEKLLLDFRKKLASTSYAIDTSVLTTRKIAREILGQRKEVRQNTLLPYIFFAAFVLIFGCVASFYRFHIREASKFEQFHIGFIRIRIAGNNSNTGFEDLVRESLTKDAFTFDLQKRKIESPLPGHPTSDIATSFLNKILDNFEVKQKVK